jgi:imidazolonepropionase
MTSADCVVRSLRRLITCRGPIPKRKESLADLGVIDNAWVASHRGKIVYAGEEPGFLRQVKVEKEAVWVDGSGSIGLPGFVDSHTHLPFAGTREEEFLLRLKGATYEQLASRGMGIRTTVEATRKTDRDELVALCLGRLDEMLLQGTTTVEAKSGYGLDLETEIKQLEALEEAAARHPVDIVPTFMGAHEIPPEFRGRSGEYVDFLISEVIPEVKKRGLAEFFDVFCERGVFSVDETRRLVEAAKEMGFKIKIHSDEFTALGGTELAAAAGARSAEHLIAVTEEGIRALAGSATAAVLLPGVSFFLMLEKRAPARKLIAAGAAVALATDFNPGSSMLDSMPFVIQLGVYTLRMTVEEAISAATANGAYAAGREDVAGTIEPGKNMDIVLCDVHDYPSLIYHVARNPVRHVIKKGKIVVRDGVRVSF